MNLVNTLHLCMNANHAASKKNRRTKSWTGFNKDIRDFGKLVRDNYYKRVGTRAPYLTATQEDILFHVGQDPFFYRGKTIIIEDLSLTKLLRDSGMIEY